MDFLKRRNRLGLYLFFLAVLSVGALAALWSVTQTGAYLTGEGDWQTLAGDYRIGTIDYTVRINDSLLLGRNESGQEAAKYRLAVPMLGGVKMFDDSVSSVLRVKEFNEGATVMRVRVTNYSKSMVEVTAQFKFNDQTGSAKVPAIRVMPLPESLTGESYSTFDSYSYILDQLAPYTSHKTAPASLTELDSAYTAYVSKKGSPFTLPMGLLPGSVPKDTPSPPKETDAIYDETTQRYYYYRDVFLVLWSEYGDGEYNIKAPAPTVNNTPDPAWTPSGTPRQGQFEATFTVGQLD